MSMMGSSEFNRQGPVNLTEPRTQLGWVTHLEAVASGCNTYNPARTPTGRHNTPDACPVDRALLAFIEAEQPALGVPYMYTELPDCGGCGDGVWRRFPSCVAKHYHPCTPEHCSSPSKDCNDAQLDPNWQKNLLAITAALKPLVDSGKIGAIQMGDELIDHGVTFENYTAVANVLRHELGSKVKIFSNDACSPPGPQSWPTIPKALDYISCDVYNVTSGRGEADKIIDYYTKYIIPKLHPHQQALLVPGTFSCETGIGITQNQSSQTAMVLQKLEMLHQFALGQPKIGGFYPWHLMNRLTMPDSKRCDYRHGAISMPAVMAKLREIGESIVASQNNHAR